MVIGKTPGISSTMQYTTGKPTNDTTFYPRVINYTTITFSNEKLQLLNKGLIYNLSHKCKQWISNPTFEAETAVTMSPPKEQEYVHLQVMKNQKKLYQQQKQHHAHQYKKTMRTGL
jgi:hypothetical protein